MLTCFDTAPAGKKDACKGEPEVLEAENGTITSQNYPQGYGEDLDCQWRIQVPQGKVSGIRDWSLITGREGARGVLPLSKWGRKKFLPC